jgi:hypothetical protein
MIDFKKPVITENGQDVTIISTEGRITEDGKRYPVLGYVGDSTMLTAWTLQGEPWNGTRIRVNLKNKPETLYLAIHANGAVGVFHAEKLAKGANAPITVKVQYTPGQKDF